MAKQKEQPKENPREQPREEPRNIPLRKQDPNPNIEKGGGGHVRPSRQDDN